jgi:hypothetical protein
MLLSATISGLVHRNWILVRDFTARDKKKKVLKEKYFG